MVKLWYNTTEMSEFSRSVGNTAPPIDYDKVPLPEWFIEPGEEFGIAPWQHTPLDPFEDDTMEQFDKIRYSLSRLSRLPVPADLSWPVKHAMMNEFDAGLNLRRMTTHSNVGGWEEQYTDEFQYIYQDPRLSDIYERAKRGYAQIPELLLLLESAPSLNGLDLAVLSTPYGYRREHLAEMRSIVQSAIKERDGLTFGKAHYKKPRINIPIPSSKEGADTIIATRRRLVGILKGAADEPSVGRILVIERGVYVIDLNTERGFPVKILDGIRSAENDEDPAFIKAKDGLRDIIMKSTKEPYIIPAMASIYAYHDCGKEELVSEESQRGEDERLSLLDEFGLAAHTLAMLELMEAKLRRGENPFKK